MESLLAYEEEPGQVQRFLARNCQNASGGMPRKIADIEFEFDDEIGFNFIFFYNALDKGEFAGQMINWTTFLRLCLVLSDQTRLPCSKPAKMVISQRTNNGADYKSRIPNVLPIVEGVEETEVGEEDIDFFKEHRQFAGFLNTFDAIALHKNPAKETNVPMIRSTHEDNRSIDTTPLTSEDEDYEVKQTFMNHSDEEQEYEKAPRKIGKSWTKENEKLPIKLPDGKIQIIAADEENVDRNELGGQDLEHASTIDDKVNLEKLSIEPSIKEIPKSKLSKEQYIIQKKKNLLKFRKQ
ncbi:7447_t:CDS:2 [Paraglomus occultum]|uniref:7447_t:CDS:1 n=1 Tax=Paraglomus occultum TaxID=144539 RepID=A0A9N8WIW3_9GLOM|nr:7447_t:CDS:2 [Paraglomus occultum]